MKTKKLLVIALLAASTACDDLEVANVQNPNRVTVVRSSQDVLALISNGLLQWFNRSAQTSPAIALSVMADEFTTGFADFGGQDLSLEPRQAINNGVPPNNAPPHHVTWPDYYANIAALNTGLQAISKFNLTLRNSAGLDVTTEAHAFAKFMQGLNHGYIALMFDKGFVFSETVDTDTLRFTGGNQGAQNLVRPYREVMDTALAEMNAALTLANSKSFSYPSVPNQWFLGIARNNTDLARIIHTYMARLMVYNARNPTERQAVNWNTVIQHIDQGITSDFTVTGTIDVVESDYKQRAARLRAAQIPSDFMRVDYRIVGPSDVSQGYINWYAQPWANRNPFRMTTIDKRVDGFTGPRPASCLPVIAAVSCGLYMGHHQNNVFNIDRGLGQRSFYFYHRWGQGTSWQLGPLTLVNMAEMDLIKAEGLIRLNRAAEAIPLINKYRVANGGLPPIVDITGVPGTAPNCAPRKLSGACGSLWDALTYEKRIETMGLEGGTAFYDARAWDFLVQGTPIHFPMPRRDAELMALEIYTFGGAGTDAAPAPNWEKCPVALPRCP
jgi:hypothetical protein